MVPFLNFSLNSFFLKMLSAAFFMPLFFIAIGQFLQISDAIDCFSCASPALHNQWEATGLPEIPPPDRFAFHACDGTGTDYKPCADVCMEMLVAAGNEYGVVRGCMSDFYHGQTTSTNTDKCYFGGYPHNVTIYDPTNGAKTYSQLYVGVRYCSTVNGACNNKFMPKKEAAEGSGAFAETFCRQTQQMPTTACLSCWRYDSAGDCNSNWKETCQGQWCTKTTGYVNGRWMESRGCAPFNPSGNSMCVKTESEHTFDLFDNHPLQMPYSLERCYCQGAHCNGAIHSIGANFVPIWWPFFVLIGIFGAKFSM